MSMCSVTIQCDIPASEFNRLFGDIAARAAWAHAYRAVRAGDEEACGPLLLEAWHLRHINSDPLRFHITQRLLDYHDRKTIERARKAIDGMRPILLGWRS